MKGRFLQAVFAAGLGLHVLAGSALAGVVKVIVADYSIRTASYFAEAEKAFEAANPGTDIRIEVVPWDALGQRLASDIAAGTNPDIAVAGTLWLVDFVKRDAVEPLDGFITDAFRARFVEPFLSAAVMDGKIYGLPIAASARALFYNKELFAKAGIAEAPKTWDELKAAAEKISAPGSESTAMACKARAARPTSIIIMRCGRRASKSSMRTASRRWRATAPSPRRGSTGS